MKYFFTVKRRIAGAAVLLLFLAGCQTPLKQSPPEEAAIDKALTQQRLPVAPPFAEPGEPQKEFKQEPPAAQG